ncbi:MAG: VOC family protein, partial [Pseudomonadota bacterium]
MITDIQGLHHVTSLASDAAKNNDFFTRVLGLRRVKKTVNFDAPEVYHLYYGDADGTPGSVMTYFPFPQMPAGRAGTGEVGLTAFAVPEGSLGFWEQRFADLGVSRTEPVTGFGERRLTFIGPDNERFALVEVGDVEAAGGTPWTGAGVGDDVAIRRFHSASMRLGDTAATAELIGFMGYEHVATEGSISRFAIPGPRANGAHVIDLEARDDMRGAGQGAGSV